MSYVNVGDSLTLAPLSLYQCLSSSLFLFLSTPLSPPSPTHKLSPLPLPYRQHHTHKHTNTHTLSLSLTQEHLHSSTNYKSLKVIKLSIVGETAQRTSRPRSCGLRLKCDGSLAETRFRLSAKRTSPFKPAGASVQSTTGSRGVRISGSNVGYIIFRGTVKSSSYPIHSPVSPSLPFPASPCAITFQLDSTYKLIEVTCKILVTFPPSGPFRCINSLQLTWNERETHSL